MKKIFLICPVRGITDEEKMAIGNYVKDLERAGNQVHLPFRDTDQNDNIGLRICQDNRAAIEWADEVHIWWNPASQGSIFDFGMAFGLKKKIVLVNPDYVKKLIEEENEKGLTGKSFNKMLYELTKPLD